MEMVGGILDGVRTKAPPRVGVQTGNSSYVRYLDFFRALTILQIVMLHAGHAFLQRGYAEPIAESDFVFVAVNVFFHDATIYFTLISGILYSRIFFTRPHGLFLKARLLNVGTPYVVVSAALTAFFWFLASRSAGEWHVEKLVGQLSFNIVTGDAWNTLWYIPVILGLYAIAPILYRIVTNPRLLWVTLILAFAPLVFSRAGTDITPATFIFFMGAFVVGLSIGRNLERSLDWTLDHRMMLALVALACSIAIAFLYVTETDNLGPISVVESFFYVQRLSMGMLILAFLRHWSRYESPTRDAILGVAASASFGIYFLHGPLLRPFVSMLRRVVEGDQSPLLAVPCIFATFLGALALSMAGIGVTQLIFGDRSRYLIGA